MLSELACQNFNFHTTFKLVINANTRIQYLEDTICLRTPANLGLPNWAILKKIISKFLMHMLITDLVDFPPIESNWFN